MQLNKKVGLLSVISMVISSQLGAGIFMLASSIGVHGLTGVIGLAIGGIITIFFAFMFSWLFQKVSPEGIYKYMEIVFNKDIAFFIGWMYWVISCIGNITYAVTCVSYFVSIFAPINKALILLLQVLVLAISTILNCLGNKFISVSEIIVSILKIPGLLLIPFFVLLFSDFDIANILTYETNSHNFFSVLQKIIFLSLWGFMGVEGILSGEDKINNPSKTIPKALIIGTLIVLLVYLINTISIMLIVPKQILSTTVTPYSDTTNILFGNHKLAYILPLMPVFISFGNLNVWTFIEANFTEKFARNNFIPKLFAIKNKFNVPYYGVIIPNAVCAVLLLVSTSTSLHEQITTIIDTTIVGIVIIYAVCAITMIKALIKKGSDSKRSNFSWQYLFIAVSSMIFCIFTAFSSNMESIFYCICIFATGIPFYLYAKIKKIY